MITFDQGTYFSASFVRHIEHSAQPLNECYCQAVVRTHAACSSSTRRQWPVNQTSKHVKLLGRLLAKTSTGIGTVSTAANVLSLHLSFAVPRTPEGFYRTTGGLQAAIDRALVYAPYADLLWLETGKPDLAEARAFARKIREKYPGKWFVYNLSPSFNWSQAGFNGTSFPNSSVLCLSTNGLSRCRS